MRAFAPPRSCPRAYRCPPLAQTTPPRGPNEGKGPFNKLVIRGVNVIDGAGGTARGPMDIVIVNNRITEVRSAGTPGVPLEPNRPPRDFDHEIDATGMWVMPGLVDEHVHAEQGGTPLTYAYKLWLAHGVTTVRGVNLTGNAAAVRDKAASEANTIVAPRIVNYQRPGSAWPNGATTRPRRGASGCAGRRSTASTASSSPAPAPTRTSAILEAMIDEAKKLGLGTTMHHSPPVYPEVNALETGRMGLGTVTHFYGHFESLLKSGRTHPFPDDYNYNDEQSRWRHVAKVIDYTFEPGSPQWWAYLNEQKANGVTFGPTMSVYEAGRDLMRARTQEWHRRTRCRRSGSSGSPTARTTAPSTTTGRPPTRCPGSASSTRYMQLVNDYKSIGGRVAGGTDAGFIYCALRLRRDPRARADAGGRLHRPRGDQRLHAPGRAHADGAEGITDPEFGMVRVGQIADLIVTPENPLANFKTLYGTGTGRLNDATGKIERVGGIRWTVRNGVVYDAKELLADVAEMVQTQKNAGGCAGMTWTGAPPGRAAAPGRRRRRSRRPRRRHATPTVAGPPGPGPGPRRSRRPGRARRATRATRRTCASLRPLG